MNLIVESQEDDFEWKIKNQFHNRSKRVELSKWLSIKRKNIDKILTGSFSITFLYFS